MFANVYMHGDTSSCYSSDTIHLEFWDKVSMILELTKYARFNGELVPGIDLPPTPKQEDTKGMPPCSAFQFFNLGFWKAKLGTTCLYGKHYHVSYQWSSSLPFLKITISNHPYPKEDYSSHGSRFWSPRVKLWSDRFLGPARKFQAEYIVVVCISSVLLSFHDCT